MNPFRTNADYEAALVRIAVLMDAEAGTPEGAELDALVNMVLACEQWNEAAMRQWERA
jgi:HTH-type transcriptional regulator/antitoxin HigA